MHEEWTDKLSEYLDGELSRDEREAVEAHLSGCASCTAVLADLKRVVERAQRLHARPPQGDLWPGISERIDARASERESRPAAAVAPFQRDASTGAGSGTATPFERRARHAASGASASRRISFTLPQLAAAAVLLIAVSAGVVWQIAQRAGTAPRLAIAASNDSGRAPAPGTPSGAADADAPRALPAADGDASGINDVQLVDAAAADPQYDAAVAELETALKKGRGRLDAATIAIVEHNLQIIDQAIDQARQALAADPANSYLSSHLFEARRRKLDLLRRAAVLSAESD
jgi:anti-sigma factor RsiW